MRRRFARRRALPRRRISMVKWFKESYPYPNAITANAQSLGTGTLSFSLEQLTNSSSYSLLYDLYKINAVKIKIIPRFNQADVLQAGNVGMNGGLPVLHIATNRDPYVPIPADLADVLNDDTCRSIRMDRPITLFLRYPKPDVLAGPEGSQISIPMQFGVKAKFQPWLTTGGNNQLINQVNVKHYGFRYVIDNQAGVDVSAQVFVTMYFAMKEQD